jgi:hypothetical protein
MIDELERIWKETTQTRYCPGIYLKGLRRFTKDVSQDSRCPDRDSNRVPSAHCPLPVTMSTKYQQKLGESFISEKSEINKKRRIMVFKMCRAEGKALWPQP